MKITDYPSLDVPQIQSNDVLLIEDVEGTADGTSSVTVETFEKGVLNNIYKNSIEGFDPDTGKIPPNFIPFLNRYQGKNALNKITDLQLVRSGLSRVIEDKTADTTADLSNAQFIFGEFYDGDDEAGYDDGWMPKGIYYDTLKTLMDTYNIEAKDASAQRPVKITYGHNTTNLSNTLKSMYDKGELRLGHVFTTPDLTLQAMVVDVSFGMCKVLFSGLNKPNNKYNVYLSTYLEPGSGSYDWEISNNINGDGSALKNVLINEFLGDGGRLTTFSSSTDPDEKVMFLLPSSWDLCMDNSFRFLRNNGTERQYSIPKYNPYRNSNPLMLFQKYPKLAAYNFYLATNNVYNGEFANNGEFALGDSLSYIDLRNTNNYIEDMGMAVCLDYYFEGEPLFIAHPLAQEQPNKKYNAWFIVQYNLTI